MAVFYAFSLAVKSLSTPSLAKGAPACLVAGTSVGKKRCTRPIDDA